MSRILVCLGRGVGNIIEMFPVIKTIKKELQYNIDVFIFHENHHVPDKIFP